jgi:hypothetical protein
LGAFFAVNRKKTGLSAPTKTLFVRKQKCPFQDVGLFTLAENHPCHSAQIYPVIAVFQQGVNFREDTVFPMGLKGSGWNGELAPASARPLYFLSPRCKIFYHGGKSRPRPKR